MSFWSKITGSLSADDYDDLFEPHTAAPTRNETPRQPYAQPQRTEPEPFNAVRTLAEEVEHVGELSVDVYETQNELVLKALVAGVQPTNIDINLTRDMITLKGTREEHKEVTEENYFHKELFWGGFSRSIVLPEEVDVDAADASIAHGILVIRLPKINKGRQTKIKVRAR